MADDWTTISVSSAALDRAKEAKESDETWNEYLERCVDAGPSGGVSIDIEALADAIAERIGTPDPAGQEIDVEVNMDELAEKLSKKLGADMENASYRGAKDAVESVSR